jgi:L-seryl-tRNA(Ser) seleniumtransferase
MVDLRELPSVDQLLQMEIAKRLSAQNGRPLVVQAARFVLASERDAILSGKVATTHPKQLAGRMEQVICEWLRPTLLPVINASGVILHTNLGRAPLSSAALHAVQASSAGYTTLEFDLDSGKRGSRVVHVEGLLTRLTGAEAALVVNNNAAALLLCLSALAKRKRVVIARSQMVEIGGGFRIPEVMTQSGARLVEVGTTNRVHLRDFEEALEEPAGMVLRAHSSNFRVIGFTAMPELGDMVRAAHTRGVPVLDDLGSGALLDTARYGLAHEPTVQESLDAGVDLVCFSGDKLLGGPQAGIILGKAEYIQKVKKHPLARAVRADKMCLSALAATLQHYLRDEAEREIPIWRMITTSLDGLQARVSAWRDALQSGIGVSCLSTVGGGSLPEETLPSWGLALHVRQPNRFLARLRSQPVPVIARVENERVLLDARTVLPEQDEILLAGIRDALLKE